MQQFFLIAHVVIAILFIVSVLIQDKGLGGFGSAIGGVGGGGGFYASQRGAAKVLHYTSVVLAIGFLATALIYVMLPATPMADLPDNGGLNPISVETESGEVIVGDAPSE